MAREWAKALVLTEWYPAEVTPVRKGWYECRWCVEGNGPEPRHFWDGKDWDANPFAGWRGLSGPTGEAR